jgi:hypothetical protein
LLYFEGALADAPASARSNVSSDPETASAAIAMTRHLDIASSIWFGTTQTKQTVKQNRLFNKQTWRFLIERLLSRYTNMIPSSEPRNNQCVRARKISSSKLRRKKWQRCALPLG